MSATKRRAIDLTQEAGPAAGAGSGSGSGSGGVKTAGVPYTYDVDLLVLKPKLYGVPGGLSSLSSGGESSSGEDGSDDEDGSDGEMCTENYVYVVVKPLKKFKRVEVSPVGYSSDGTWKSCMLLGRVGEPDMFPGLGRDQFTLQLLENLGALFDDGRQDLLHEYGASFGVRLSIGLLGIVCGTPYKASRDLLKYMGRTGACDCGDLCVDTGERLIELWKLCARGVLAKRNHDCLRDWAPVEHSLDGCNSVEKLLEWADRPAVREVGRLLVDGVVACLLNGYVPSDPPSQIHSLYRVGDENYRKFEAAAGGDMNTVCSSARLMSYRRGWLPECLVNEIIFELGAKEMWQRCA